MTTLYKCLIGVAIVAILLLVGFKIFTKSPKIPANNVASLIKLQQDTTSHIKKKDGTIHAEVPVVTDPDRDAVIALYKDSLAHMATELDIKQAQINQFGNITTDLRDRLTVVTKYVDSSKSAIQVQGGDRYVDISGIVNPKSGVSYLDYSSKDTLHYVFYTNHLGFFKNLTTNPGQTFDVSAANKKNYISNIKSVIIPPAKDGHLKLGFGGGYGVQMNTKTNTFTAGPEVLVGLLYKF